MEPSETATESALLKRVDHGLELAVRKSGLQWEDERNNVKREKYTYFAVRDHCEGEFPVTYSWYRYGISAIAPNLERSLETENRNQEIFTMDEEDFAEYFLTELPHMEIDDWWPDEVTVLDFLREFYDRCCPDNLRDMYLANVGIRKILENGILHRIDSGAESIPEEDYHELQENLLCFQTELASDEAEDVFDEAISLTDLYTDFIEYSDLLEDAVLVAKQREGLSGSEYRAFTKLKNVFDSTVWPLITIVISARTGIGPNAGIVESIAEGKYKQLSRDIQPELKASYRICQKSDLIADIADYEDTGGDVESEVDELMGVIDGDVSKGN